MPSQEVVERPVLQDEARAPVQIMRRQTLGEILRETPIAVTIASLLATLAILFCGFEYVRLAVIADRRLASGPFSTSIDIYSAPETIAVGETLTPADLERKLERAGLTPSHRNPGGWFDAAAQTVRFQAGEEADTVQVDFAAGKISQIVGASGSQKSSEIPAQLLMNLGASRDKRRLVKFSQIPPSLLRALTSAEDKHFFHHGGVDLARAVKAAWVDVRDGRKQEGASTLTMQLARSMWLDSNKSWWRKFEEILITIHLEQKLSKQQILEDYANEVYLGRSGTFSIRGFGEGARAFFGKELSQIDTSEAALLAGLVRQPSFCNPFRYPARARERRDVVLALMRRNGQLDEAGYRAVLDEPLHIVQPVAGDSANSYFIAMMNDDIQSTLGDSAKLARSVETTLDPNLQAAAEAAVRLGMAEVDRQLAAQTKRGKLPPDEPQVALVALDPHTGEVKALVGGRNYTSSQLNHALAMRQPGSAFKPFVYAAAINTGVEGGSRVFTPASMLDDDPSTSFSFDGRTYQPRDFGGDYMGEVPLRMALARSSNVATVSLAQQVGYQRVVAMAQRAGLGQNIKATPAVALGAYEATPLEIAAAYTIFANQGSYVRPATIALARSADGGDLYRHEVDAQPVLDPRVAYIMTNLMQGVIDYGTGAPVRARGFMLPAAGKTGTSRDGWFAGFTTQLLCVVWVGFDDNRDLNLEGAKSALPIWAEFMKRAAELPQYRQASAFKPPSGVVSVEICPESGQLAGPLCPEARPEVFIRGTEPRIECPLHGVDTSDADGANPLSDTGAAPAAGEPAKLQLVPTTTPPAAPDPSAPHPRRNDNQ